MTASYEQIIGGRYALYGPIASGGMAAVHFGRLLGTGGFARTVAIKRLRGEFLDKPEVITTLLDEARLASRIRHPNVVQTLDMVAGEDEVFLIMDYVVGETLARLLGAAIERGDPTDPRIATGIMTGVLYGLHAAHDATDEHGEALHIVHRDVSPQNVLVGADGLARLLDFGIAKGKGRLQTTRAGQLKGKVSYMSPEQILGDEPDRRSDVYAAAVVLWETLTGRRLFPAGETVAQSYDAIPRILEADVDPPSVVAPDVPGELDAIVMRGLNRHRETRWETARDFAVALEEAVGVATTRQIGEWVQRLAEATLAERAATVRELESQLPVGDRPSLNDIVDATVSRRRKKKLSEAAKSDGESDSQDGMADRIRSSKRKRTKSSSAKKKRRRRRMDPVRTDAERGKLLTTVPEGQDDGAATEEVDDRAVTREAKTLPIEDEEAPVETAPVEGATVEEERSLAETKIYASRSATEPASSKDASSTTRSAAVSESAERSMSSSGRRDVELARRIDARDREQARAFIEAQRLAKDRSGKSGEASAASSRRPSTDPPASFEDAVQLPVQSNRGIIVVVVVLVVIALVLIVTLV